MRALYSMLASICDIFYFYIGGIIMSTLHADPEKQRQIRIKIENLTIALLAAFSLFLFILTFFPFSRISQTMQISFEMGRMVQRAFSIILFTI